MLGKALYPAFVIRRSNSTTFRLGAFLEPWLRDVAAAEYAVRDGAAADADKRLRRSLLYSW